MATLSAINMVAKLFLIALSLPELLHGYPDERGFLSSSPEKVTISTSLMIVE